MQHAAYLLLRGMKTLGVRVARQNDNAMKLATRLEKHPRIARVHYPGLASHQDHSIAASQANPAAAGSALLGWPWQRSGAKRGTAQMSGFGGVVSFEVDGDLWTTAKFVDGCRLPYIAPSLGGVSCRLLTLTLPSVGFPKPPTRAACGVAVACLSLWRCARFPLGDSVRRAQVESLIEQPTIISYWDQGPEKRAEIGIKARCAALSPAIRPCYSPRFS